MGSHRSYVTCLVSLLALGCPSADTTVAPGTGPEPVVRAAVLGAPIIATRASSRPLSAAPVAQAPLPTTRMIVRDCDGELGLRERARGLGPWVVLSATGCGAEAPQSVPTTASEPSPAEADDGAPSPAAEPVDAVASSPVSGEAAATPKPAAPPKLAPAPRPAREAKGGKGRGGDLGRAANERRDAARQELSKDEEKPPIEAPKIEAPTTEVTETITTGSAPAADELEEELHDDQDPRDATRDLAANRQKQKAKPEPELVYDWGGTVYLSNDDSMSLASAQRVLYALNRDLAIDPFQVRKHELLNYFSFDTAEPEGRTFAVLGTAERTGDTLSVALAVRGANPERAPLDLTILVDRSGSMNQEGKMDYTRRGLHKLMSQLQRGDRVDLVLFDTKVCTPIEGLVVGRDDASLMTAAIDNMTPGGGTDLDAGLREAYRIQTGRDNVEVHGRNRRVLLVTDAVLNSGNVDQGLVSNVGRALDEHDVHLSGVGVGSDFNDDMLDLLTEKGRGAYVFLGSEAVVDRVFGLGFDSLVRTVAEDVHFSLDLPDSLAMGRFYGEESSTRAADVKPTNFHAGTSQLFLQDLAIHDGNLVGSDPISMKITYRDAISHEPVTEELRTTVGALLDADRHNVIKAKALMAFADWVTVKDTRGACGEPLRAFRSQAARIADDAEIAYVDGLVARTCGAAPARPATVELRIKLDTDVPVSAIDVQCGGDARHLDLSPSDTVGRFDVTPGACTVSLQGATPMVSTLEVAETGGDAWCRVRAGRVRCS